MAIESTRVTRATFYFDPSCPWTWLTSRWLADVAEHRDVQIEWRSFSLVVLNGGLEKIPAQYRPGAEFATSVLRMVEALRAADRNADIGRLYTAVGTRVHDHKQAPNSETLAAAARESGTEDVLSAAEDPQWDEVVEASTHEATEISGPGVGSPVLALGGANADLHGTGLFGPIVGPVPRGEDGLRIWDAVVTLTEIPTFFELKRGRSGPAPVGQ